MELTRTDGSPLRVLVVDDEVNIAELITMALRYEGWEVRMAHTGAKAVAAAKEFRPDAVVLDMMLPDFDGLEVLRRMRASEPGVPVLFLTARDSVEDRVAGLTAGGDDYVTKPFSLEEVVARLRALMRRAGAQQAEERSILTVGDLTMDEDSHEVFRDGDEVALTATEFELLRFLMRNPRRVLSKAQILDRVWNYDFGGQANVVELYISYLRKKIDAGREPMIHTMRGAGYVLKPVVVKWLPHPQLAPRAHAGGAGRVGVAPDRDGDGPGDALLPRRAARPGRAVGRASGPRQRAPGDPAASGRPDRGRPAQPGAGHPARDRRLVRGRRGADRRRRSRRDRPGCPAEALTVLADVPDRRRPPHRGPP